MDQLAVNVDDEVAVLLVELLLHDVCANLLFEPKNPSPFSRDHRLMPGWIPNNFDVRLLDRIEHQQLLLSISSNHCAHPAAGSGQCHFHVHSMMPARKLLNMEIVHEAEIDDVHGNFRIVTGAEGIP